MTYRQIVNGFNRAEDKVQWIRKHTDFEKGTLCGRQLYKKDDKDDRWYDTFCTCDVFILTDSGRPSRLIKFRNFLYAPTYSYLDGLMSYAIEVSRVAKEA